VNCFMIRYFHILPVALVFVVVVVVAAESVVFSQLYDLPELAEVVVVRDLVE
jgi:hypothetical protein